jgi:hypothetical protein
LVELLVPEAEAGEVLQAAVGAVVLVRVEEESVF